MRAVAASWWERAWQPIDGAALAAFRVIVGALIAISAARFLAYGWVDRFFVAPTFYFSYWGFEWVRPLPPPGMHVVFAALIAGGVLVALGALYRVAIVTTFVLFAYVQLCDLSNYLNHYYLVTLLLFLMCFLPLHRTWSVDARWRPAIALGWQPAWMLWLLRFQIGCVYVFAALAKLTPDWLLHAQPLQIWLSARADTPVIGGLFDLVEVAYAMSWAGFLYDLTIPIWLSWRRTRVVAYVVLVGFHAMTQVLFAIGMFPLIMTAAALVFFEPSWPRAVMRALRVRVGDVGTGDTSAPAFRGATALAAVALAAWCTFHVAMPLRAHAYGGNLLWHEQGMRWSWRVLCREKNGSVTYRVRARGWPRERLIAPGTYLNGDQEREFAAQPDMILQLAHHIRADLEARGFEDVEVRVDALASLNGRRMARLIDPDVDLARVEDSILPATWILPAPGGPPPQHAARTIASVWP